MMATLYASAKELLPDPLGVAQSLGEAVFNARALAKAMISSAIDKLREIPSMAPYEHGQLAGSIAAELAQMLA